LADTRPGSISSVSGTFRAVGPDGISEGLWRRRGTSGLEMKILPLHVRHGPVRTPTSVKHRQDENKAMAAKLQGTGVSVAVEISLDDSDTSSLITSR